mgnify:CR=1 FL=1
MTDREIIKAAGITTSDIARALEISRLTVRKFLQEERDDMRPLYRLALVSTLAAIRKALDNGELPMKERDLQRRAATLKSLVGTTA